MLLKNDAMSERQSTAWQRCTTQEAVELDDGAGANGNVFAYYNGARWYMPEYTRYTQMDPAGFVPSSVFSPYVYALNDPANIIDPTGNGALGAIMGSALLGAVGATGGALVGGAGGGAAATLVGATPVGAVAGSIYGEGLGFAEGSTLGAGAGSWLEDALNSAFNALSKSSDSSGNRNRSASASASAPSQNAQQSSNNEPPESPTVERRGEPVNVPRVTNPDTSIGGRDFTGHAIDLQGRGVPPSAVENTIRTGTASLDPIVGCLRFYDPVNNLTVITEQGGAVITVITSKL